MVLILVSNKEEKQAGVAMTRGISHQMQLILFASARGVDIIFVAPLSLNTPKIHEAQIVE